MSVTSLSAQEYIELLQKLVDNQYDDDSVDVDDIVQIPIEIEAPKEIPKVNIGMIDLTHVKSSKLKEEITKCGNIRVGAFKIVITHYSSFPKENGAQLCVNIDVREEKTKTPNGQDCRIDCRADLLRDSRFKDRPWLKYFKDGSYARQVPIDTIIDIVRWLQMINKLPAFT